MPRISRTTYQKGFFHIMSQGIEKNKIFKTNKEKEKYVHLIEKYLKDYDISIIAYCVMTNHVHLLIYTNDILEISKFMKVLNSSYGTFYNKINNRVGFVYRNRFQSQYIYDNSYLKNCIKYIHMNPVKANMVKSESEYNFSSYNSYIENKENSIINKEKIIDIFQKKEYIKEFKQLKDEEIEIMDIDREEENFKIAVKNYLLHKNTTLEEIKHCDINLINFCKTLKEKGYTQKQISKLLEISESVLSRKIKR